MTTRRGVRSDWKLLAVTLLFLVSAILPAAGWSGGAVLAADQPQRAESVAKVAKSTASRNVRDARFAHDGKASTTWSAVEDDRRSREEEGSSGRRVRQSWIAFDLGGQKEIVGVGWRLGEAGSGSATIQCSSDGKKWTTAAKLGRTPIGRWQRDDVRCEARHVRFSFGRSESGSWSMSEVRVFTALATAPSDPGCQRVAVPAYFDDFWPEMTAAAPTVGLVILNPNSGPDIKYQEHWLTRTSDAQAAGITVVGYVRTKFDPNQGDTEDPDFKGRRDAGLIRDEIDLYYQWYKVDGIYFDEFDIGTEMIPYYRTLASHTRNVDPNAVVAINPGWTPDERVMEFVNIVETYEYDYDTYQTQQFPAWTRNYPAERFMHVVHSVPDADAATWVLDLAKERNAGYVFLTDVEDPDFIYKSLGGNLWNNQLDYVRDACQ